MEEYNFDINDEIVRLSTTLDAEAEKQRKLEKIINELYQEHETIKAKLNKFFLHLKKSNKKKNKISSQRQKNCSQ